MIHIVFQEPDIDVLKQAIALDEAITGPVWLIADDYAVGPLKDIYTDEGIEQRRQWWREVLAGTELEGKVDDGSVDDARVVTALRKHLDADAAELALADLVELQVFDDAAVVVSVNL